MYAVTAKDEERLLKGTTTIGIVCKDGVVLATERRATAGTMIANKSTNKLFKIDQNIGMTVAGLVGDAQVLGRYLRAEVSLYRLRRSAPLSTEGAATLLANILSGNRMFPYYAWLILGGVDGKGGHVFSVDPAGGSIEDRVRLGRLRLDLRLRCPRRGATAATYPSPTASTWPSAASRSR